MCGAQQSRQLTASHSRDMICPSFTYRSALSRNRGRREDRVHAAPAVSRAMCTKECSHEHTGSAEASGLPCAMALRLIRARPGETLLCVTIVSDRRQPVRLLATCIGAAGPHDFAVRLAHTRPCTLGGHRIFIHVRDVRETPLVSDETGALDT